MLDLTHAKSIQINGKEVKKLEIGNRVIWEKKTFESLILSASSNIVSAGDTVTLSAQLADANNNPVNVSGENVTFEVVTFIKKVDNVVCTSNTQTQLDINSFENGDEIQFEVSNISGEVWMFWYNNTTGGEGYPIRSIVEGSTVNLVNDKGRLKVYVDKVFIYSVTVNPEWVAFGINLAGVPSSCTVSDYTHKRTETLNDISNSSGIASVSYLVKDTNTLNIKAKSSNIKSNLITLSNILWQPELNGETGASYRWSYSEANGEAIGKGFTLKGGFPNIDKWELSFEFKHDNIRYTGIGFLTGNFTGTDTGFMGYYSWEGSWPGGTPYASYNSGSVGWFDVTVTKIDSTHLRLQSKILNRDTTIEWAALSDYEILSCGAVHNRSSSSFGPCRIRNIKVIKL